MPFFYSNSDFTLKSITCLYINFVVTTIVFIAKPDDMIGEFAVEMTAQLRWPMELAPISLYRRCG